MRHAAEVGRIRLPKYPQIDQTERGETVVSDLASISRSVRGLQGDAAAGTLQLDADAASRAAQACEQMIRSLNQLKYRADRLKRVDGCQGFGSSERLAERLGNVAGEADGGDESTFTGVVQQHIEVLTRLRDVYIKAGEAYQDAHDNHKINFDQLTTQITAFDPDTGKTTTATRHVG